jgi:hypothetical protein
VLKAIFVEILLLISKDLSKSVAIVVSVTERTFLVEDNVLRQMQELVRVLARLWLIRRNNIKEGFLNGST